MHFYFLQGIDLRVRLILALIKKTPVIIPTNLHFVFFAYLAQIFVLNFIFQDHISETPKFFI